MTTFTRAQTVDPGDPVTSTQYRSLARAVNDRMRFAQDFPWRAVYYWLGLARQIRNPSGLAFPSQAELLEFYAHLDPDYHGGTTWPTAGPGEPEGTNLANPLAQFVFGIDPTLDWEDVRVNAVPLPENLDPAELWWIGAAQAGAYDPATGAQNWPAATAAQAAFAVVQPKYSPHGKSYGGFFPTPEKQYDHCDTGDGADLEGGAYIPSWKIKFTALRPDVSTTGLHGTITTDAQGNPVCTYTGSCPCWTDRHAAGHVMAIAQFSLATLVYVGLGGGCEDYAVDRFPTEDWIQGPYTGDGVLSHDEGEQLERALWAFALDFRGTPTQRQGEFDIASLALDFEGLFARQYPLAPNRALAVGSDLVPIYPVATFAGARLIPAGTLGTWGGELYDQESDTDHHCAEGFLTCGALVQAAGLEDAITLEFLDADDVFATVRLTPDAEGDASTVRWFASPRRTNPLQVRLAGDLSLAEGGSLVVTVNERLQYHAQWWDLYLLARLAASAGGGPEESGVDGAGRDCANAAAIAANLYRYGAILNLHGAAGVRDQAEWINDNPVFEAARRVMRDHVRVTRRQHLVGYEVASGKSILYFKRHAYGMVNTRADAFADIGPPLDAITPGDLIEGLEYIVHSEDGNGSATYLGATYWDGETFTAGVDRQFQTHGDGNVYLRDGICHTAPKQGFSNQWLMGLQLKPCRESGSSIWRPESFADYFALLDRCHFYSGTPPSKHARAHMTYNHQAEQDGDFSLSLAPMRIQQQMIAPEAPTAYRYVEGANRSAYTTAAFCASCRVYEPPYEIESAVVDTWDADQVLKVTLTGRLRAHPNAPAAVNRDPSTWSSGEIEALRGGGASPEDYRTDDNAIREYILSLADGNYPCTWKTGDAGVQSSAQSLSDAPNGACYPHFLFAHLLREPYEDENDEMEEHDSKIYVDEYNKAEVYLRAMAEGFVDGITSLELTCENETFGIYDFTWPTLNYQAHGGRWCGAIALATRPEHPEGFGPLPNTPFWADVHNRLASCANLLDKLRLDVPIELDIKVDVYDGSKSVTTQGDPSACWLDRATAPPADTLDTAGSWYTETYFTVRRLTRLDDASTQASSNEVAQYKIAIQSAYEDAIPEHIQELIDAGQTGFIAKLTYDWTDTQRRTAVPYNDSDGCCYAYEEPCPGYWNAGGEYYAWLDLAEPEDEIDCQILTSGSISAADIPTCDLKFGVRPDSLTCRNIPACDLTLEILQDSAFVQVPLVDL